jgi:tetratricopeptide (TPR) repeat protein
MNSGNILNLTKILDKNPKSQLFARITDELRVESHVKGYEKKLDEALIMANKGLAVNQNFLPGYLARGRVLFEKGDFIGAVADFQVVAERDPFCLSAGQMLLESSEKLGQPPRKEIYAKILDAFKMAKSMENKKDAAPENVPDIKPYERPTTAIPVAKTAPININAALDSILDEEENKEDEISELLLKSFNKIFENPKEATESLPPVTNTVIEKAPEVKSPPPALESTAHQAPNVDDIITEQLASKQENIPDLTGDMEALLKSTPPAALESTAHPTPNIDSIITEQLASKQENLPDLTGDMEALLKSAPPSALESTSLSTPAGPSTPNIDDIITEQLASKQENIPDLTSDMESLLKGTSPGEPDLIPYQPKPKQPASVTVDDLIKEQLSDRMENIPDLTKDIDSLLKTDGVIAQTPTPTLAELYLDQGHPQKAVEVYKELLAKDPGNVELQAKLALAETKL